MSNPINFVLTDILPVKFVTADIFWQKYIMVDKEKFSYSRPCQREHDFTAC